MEAEARDSDEETEEDSNVKQLGQGSITGGISCLPRDVLTSAVPRQSGPALGTVSIKQEVSSPVKTPCHNFEDILMANQLPSTPYKESRLIKVSGNNCKVLGDFSNLNKMDGSHSASKETSHHDTPVISNNIINLNKQSNVFTPDTGNKASIHSDAVEGKFGSLGYSRKKPRRSVSIEDEWGRIEFFHEKLQVNDVSMLSPKQDAGNFPFAAIQSPATFANLNHMEGPSGVSPLKRKVAVPRFDSVSPKPGFENLKASAPENSLGASTSAQSECLLSNDTLVAKPGCPLTDEKRPSDMTVLASSMVNQDRSSLRSNSTAFKKKPMKHNSASRANYTASFSDGQVADLFCNTPSTCQQDNQGSTSEELPSLGKGVSGGTVSPIGHKLTKFQDCSLVESPTSKISISNNVNNFRPLPTNDKHADDMSPKCKTLKMSLLNETAQSLQPDKGDVSAIELSNIQNGTRQNEKAIDQRSSYCGDEDSGMRMLQNAADSNIHHNSSAKTLSKKASAKRKLGCKFRSSAVSSSKGTGYSNESVKPHESSLGPGKVKETSREEKDSDGNNEMVATVSKDAVMEDLVKGCNSAYKESRVSAGINGDLQLTEKSIARESSPGIQKEKDLIFKEAVDDRKNEIVQSVSVEVMREKVRSAHKPAKRKSTKKAEAAMIQVSSDAEKENKPEENVLVPMNSDKDGGLDIRVKYVGRLVQKNKIIDEVTSDQQQSHHFQKVISEPAWFILSGHRWQRKEFQMIIRRLRGRLCNDSHHWSYKATHFIVPEPVRRTEKFFAATASGRWILKTDYLTASKEAGKFLEEEPFEWNRSGLTEDGAINLEAPRKWRLLRERTGHGALYGMQIIIYGESIVPPTDTLKRVVKAGDGTILATSPPYTRFLKSEVDFAIISPGMPRVDSWIQEFIRHEIPCILADYLVEYVCKPGFPLDKHVLYKTNAWAEKSIANLLRRSEEIVTAVDSRTPSEDPDDLSCLVCGSRDRGEVMLICGDEGGSRGCGIGMHIDCCDPPLGAVPEEDWFCSNCTQNRTRKAPVKGRRKT